MFKKQESAMTNPCTAAIYLSRLISFQTVNDKHDQHVLTWAKVEDRPAIVQYIIDWAETLRDYGVTWRWFEDCQYLAVFIPGEDQESSPMLLMSHLDVWPVENATEWMYPPFSGEFRNGDVCGRGALDHKSGLAAQMHALEEIFTSGQKPRRNIVLGMGTDEESGGERTAKMFREHWKDLGSPDVALDEGSFVVRNVGVPMAVIAVGERTTVLVEVTSHGQETHISMPNPRKPIAGNVMFEFGLGLDKNHLHNMLHPTTLECFARTFHAKTGLPLWFLRWVLRRKFVQKRLFKFLEGHGAMTNALVTNTTVMGECTVGGGDPSRLSPTASGIATCKVLPDFPKEEFEGAIREIAKDLTISFDGFSWMPKRRDSTPWDSKMFRKLEGIISAWQPGLMVAPVITTGATDMGYLPESCEGFRFLPFAVHAGVLGETEDTLQTMHGANERIGIENLRRGVKFYKILLQTAF